MVNKVNFKIPSQLIIKETFSSTVQHDVWTFKLKWRTLEMFFLFSSYLHWKRSVKVSHHSFESTCFVTSVDFQIIFSRISEIEVSLLLYYSRSMFSVTLSLRSKQIISIVIQNNKSYIKTIIGLYFKTV